MRDVVSAPKALQAGLASIIGELDTRRGVNSAALTLQRHLHDPLVHGPSHGRSTGLLEEPVREVAPDRYRIVVDGRARFHDGSAVLAEDVAASIAELAAAPQSSPLASLMRPVLGASAVGRREVEITTAGPLPRLADRLLAVRVRPAGATGQRRRVGTGPFQLVELSSTHAILRPATRYPRPRADRRGLEFRTVLSSAERLDLLRQGKLHVAESISAKVPSVARAVVAGEIRQKATPSHTMLWMMFNCQDRAFADNDVRRRVLAAAHCAMVGLSSPELSDSAGEWLHPGHPERPGQPIVGSVPVEPCLPGRPLRVEVLVTSEDWVVVCAARLAQHLTSHGVHLKLKVVHAAEAFTSDVPRGAYQAVLGTGDPSRLGAADSILAVHLTGYWAAELCRWRTPGAAFVGSALTKAAGLPSGPTRDGYLAAALQHVAREAPMGVLGHHRDGIAWSPRVTGFSPRRAGLNLRDAALT